MKHFKIEELIRCYRNEGRCPECPLKQRAERVPNDAEANERALVEAVLDPAREKLGRPIAVNSGFRCVVHNRKVGGATSSQHMRGEAADIRPVSSSRFQGSSSSSVEELAKVIVENGVFDQLIIYPTFVHVSNKRNGYNRKEILRKTASGYARVQKN